MTDQPAWERRPGETAQQHRILMTYIEMGRTRSLQAVNDKLKRPPSSVRIIKEWSRKNDWMQRTQAWDDDQAARRREKFQAETDQATERWVRQAVALQVPAALVLQELHRRLETGEIDLTDLDDAALLDLVRDTGKTWKMGLDVERLARGLETARIQHQGSVQTNDPLLAAVLTDPEARSAAEALVASMTRRKPAAPENI